MPDFTNLQLYDEILEFSKQSAALNLLEAGVDTNFTQKILEVLNSSVVSSGDIDDLIAELEQFITGGSEGVGALQRYVSQVSSDSLTQFNATYNQTITQDLGIEFYKYTGTKISDTRAFCVDFMQQYFHKKEVEKLGEAINPLTNKGLTPQQLKGRINGTNKSSIFINRGGWNCRHFFSPISPRFVPKNVLIRNVKNGNWQPNERETRLLV
jgi:hypothetical protein